MFKRDFENCDVQITDFAFSKIMAWAQALDEIVFLTAGKNLIIEDAYRLLNISNAPRNYFDYLPSEEKRLRKYITSLGLDVICMGHSHPNKGHLKYPSKTDHKYLPKHSLQMIIFPLEFQITLWFFQKSYKETVQNPLTILIKDSGLSIQVKREI